MQTSDLNKERFEILDEIKNRLIKVYHPDAIYLYSSYAWGSPNKDSDIDLAVVIKSTDLNMADRMRLGLKELWDIPFSVDILVFTAAEIEDRIQYHSTLQYKIINKGVKIYEAA